MMRVRKNTYREEPEVYATKAGAPLRWPRLLPDFAPLRPSPSAPPKQPVVFVVLPMYELVQYSTCERCKCDVVSHSTALHGGIRNSMAMKNKNCKQKQKTWNGRRTFSEAGSLVKHNTDTNTPGLLCVGFVPMRNRCIRPQPPRQGPATHVRHKDTPTMLRKLLMRLLQLIG